MLNAELVAVVSPADVAETGETLVTVPERVPAFGLVPIASVIWLVAVVTRLLKASRTSTWIAGAMATVAVALDGWTTKFRFAAAAGLTTTVPVCATATALIVADTVFDSATVDDRVPVATPLALVTPAGCVRVFPVPVAARTTVAPAIGFPLASFAVTVMVLWLAPLDAVIGDVTARVERAPETVPAWTTTVAVWMTDTVPFTVADTVFDSAAVDVNDPVATPLASVTPTGCVIVLLVPVTASTTVAPATGLPSPSRAVTVTVDPAPPAVIGEVADSVVCEAETAPAVTLKVVLVAPVRALDRAVRV